MKKVVLLCACMLVAAFCHAQAFEDYFENKTLRIDYKHYGNAHEEGIALKDYHVGGIWSGTRAYLVEPNRYGSVLFEVFDSISGKLLFSRSYDCLFNEYRTTDRAQTDMYSFEECINMPLPKKTVNYKFTGYDRKGNGTMLYTNSYNPKVTPTLPFTKDNGIIKLHEGGKSEECMDILFIPDGYSKADKGQLDSDVKRFADYVLNCSPYKENVDRINIYAVKGFSPESGITDPNNNIHRNTLINCSYNTIETDRYLMCENVWKMYDIAEDAPFDVIVIICNSSKYGGGGIYNFYATVCNGAPQADFVVVHEMGHLIGGLADEYYTSETSVNDYYPAGVEPMEPNVTTLVNFDAKWKNMMDKNTPVPTPATKEYNGTLGVYEGAGYVAEGVYRPWQNCTMKEIIYDNFCPVCTKVLQAMFDYYSNK